jgi:peptidyl-prolyl cis-trans isomerase SurA
VPSLAEAPGAATASTATGSANPTAAVPATGQVGAPGTAAEDQVGVANPETGGSSSSQAAAASQSSSATPPAKNTQVASSSSQKPGKKEKIRFGQPPTKTLPAAATTQTVDAGAVGASADSSNAAQNGTSETQLAANASGDASAIGATAPSVPEKKTRYSDRAKIPKEKKAKEPKVDPFAPPPVSAQEVADRQTQSAPLGLSGDSTKKTKKPKPTEKTRLQDQPKNKSTQATDDGSAPAPAPDTQPASPPTTK